MNGVSRKIHYPRLSMSAQLYSLSGKNAQVGGSHDEIATKPFAGCANLLDQYRQVGSALLSAERRHGIRILMEASADRIFSVDVSYVPVEVLDSYLDDILDLSLGDEGLFISKPSPPLRGLIFIALSFLALASVALHNDQNTSLGVQSWLLPGLIAITFVAGIGSALCFIPRTKVVRRFSFARLVAHEIFRRRGSGPFRTNVNYARLIGGELFAARQTPWPTAPMVDANPNPNCF